jgi:hypothetical protein
MNLTSLNEAMSRMGPGFRGASRVEQQTNARRQHPRDTKPVMRTVHPKPAFGKRACNMIGNTIPPTLEPDTAMLDAVARRRLKCV